MVQKFLETVPFDSPGTRGAVEREAAGGHEVTVLESIHGIDRERWNAVVERADRGSVFHRYEWLEAVEIGLDRPARHVLVTKDGNPIGLLPNVVVDLPKLPLRRLWSSYPGFGGPVVTTDAEDCLSLLLETVPPLCGPRTVVHEIRTNDVDNLRYNDLLRERGYRPSRVKGRFVLDLEEGYEAIRANASRSRRKGIERGRAGDAEVVAEPISETTLREFHALHERHMGQVGGDAAPRAFFEALAGMDSRLLLLQARVDGDPVAGFLEVLDEERSAVHGFYAAVPEESYQYHASELLYDAVFRWAIDRGYETYDFGGATGDFRSGVFRFKEGFGGRLAPNLYWERGTSLAWPLVRAGRNRYLRRRQ